MSKREFFFVKLIKAFVYFCIVFRWTQQLDIPWHVFSVLSHAFNPAETLRLKKLKYLALIRSTMGFINSNIFQYNFNFRN